MQVENNKVVSFYYQLRECLGGEEAREIENNRKGDPLAYLHGYRNILLGLETELTGKEVGDTISVTLKPEEAYGLHNEDAVSRVPLKRIRQKGNLKPGMVAQIQTSNGLRDAVVVKVGRFNVDVDKNHPLAGKTLTFEIEITDVREATEEELAHGHAHGVGGHQH